MNKKILIVDDEKEIVDLLEVYLSNDGYSVYKCYNGLEAMKCIKQSQIDLAILDIMLPDIDGFRLCQKIREKFYFPIIMLTAKIEDSDKIMGLTIGADDYITKPFNVKLLLTRCGNLLKNRKKLLGKIAQTEKMTTPETGILNVMDQELLDKATIVIRRNFDNPDFDMNMLAAELNMGRSKMFTRLKEVVGLTPNEFTLKLKLEEALRMLQEAPQYNISEISYQLGFASPRYFSRCFKDFYGVSPLSYRKETSNEAESK